MIALVRAAIIVSCGLAACGGTSPSVISANQYVLSIAVDADAVYWTTPGGVYSAPKDGTNVTPTKLAALRSNGNAVIGVAVDALDVYWADPGTCRGNGPADGAIMKVPIGGGTPIVLADQQCSPQSIAIDDDTVYWTNATGVLKVPKVGGLLDAVDLGETSPVAVSVSGSNVSWTDETGTLYVAATANGPPTTLARGLGILHGLAIDGTSAYWTEFNGSPGALMTVPLVGGTPTMLATDDDEPKWVAVDEAYVYWTNHAQVQRTRLDASQTETLADGEYDPTALAVDDAYVYWGDNPGTNTSVVGLKRIAK